MRMVDLILKKRNGKELTDKEINYIITGYTSGEIPDYQMSALMMAIYFRGMNEKETALLTNAMVKSGETIDLSGINGHKVDKHSTGGVGDKTSLIVAPLVASVGIPVAKMSGRGLGHTGGTLDKLESIQGFKVELSKQDFIYNVNKYKIAIAGQSGNLTPADKKLYSLRDVTATVDSIPLIASSIMSKKIASGADSIVLDVKTGSGAFMKSLEEANKLAEEMVSIGKNLGRKTIAVISDMNQPLGFEVGNANEVKEAIKVLQGEDIKDLKTLSLELSAQMALVAEIFPDYETAYKELEQNLRNGRAYNVFREFVGAQYGNVELVDNPDKLPSAAFEIEVKALEQGYVQGIDTEAIGIAAMYLGAGRATKGDNIDHAVGITLKKKVGDKVNKGDVLAILHSNNQSINDSTSKVQEAYTLSENKRESYPLIYKVIK